MNLLAGAGCENAERYIEELMSGAHYEWSSHHAEAPTLWCAVEWLREEKQIYIGVNYSPTMKLFFGTAVVNNERINLQNGTAETYDDCVDQCAIECLEKYVEPKKIENVIT